MPTKTSKTHKKKEISFHITTICNSELNFFTTAKNHKEALLNLINNSWDYNNLVKDGIDIVIKIKKL